MALQDEPKTRSRRALLAGALGGIGALAASAIGRVAPVRAAEGDVLHAGDELTATTVTKLTTTGAAALAGESGSSNGVVGISDSYIGVYATSGSYIGAYGTSTSYVGVWGETQATEGAAILGRGYNDTTGILGVSGTGIPVTKPKTGVYGYAGQGDHSKGVWGYSPAGHGLHGESSTGWAGYFAGKVYTSRYHEMKEISAPAAPAVNKVRLFARDNGSGKTQLCVRFNTGGVLVLKTQP